MYHKTYQAPWMVVTVVFVLKETARVYKWLIDKAKRRFEGSINDTIDKLCDLDLVW